ncbi:hypothetical protein BDV28DRAFT_159613 [Aspergillus coremiiformis]|uniref:Uncharacterized protein n=1 Tax=Aspergillus coremiiformis TaxID=138285 RepID=A0A5N6YYD2_9EURO|nr:hypothetical protein BDV28DRAFT_159613 [Aspergillus coremiiformis]
MPLQPGTEEVPQNGLTEENLALHTVTEESREPDNSIMSWMEKVIADERIHRLHSQLGAEHLKAHNQNNVNIEQAMDQLNQAAFVSNTREIQDQLSETLKLFEQQQGMYRETPLERFLTPDGCSDLSYYARDTLAEIGTGFGDMEGQDKRRAKVEQNMDLVIRNKRSQA